MLARRHLHWRFSDNPPIPDQFQIKLEHLETLVAIVDIHLEPNPATTLDDRCQPNQDAIVDDQPGAA